MGAKLIRPLLVATSALLKRLVVHFGFAALANEWHNVVLRLIVKEVWWSLSQLGDSRRINLGLTVARPIDDINLLDELMQVVLNTLVELLLSLGVLRDLRLVHILVRQSVLIKPSLILKSSRG